MELFKTNLHFKFNRTIPSDVFKQFSTEEVKSMGLLEFDDNSFVVLFAKTGIVVESSCPSVTTAIKLVTYVIEKFKSDYEYNDLEFVEFRIVSRVWRKELGFTLSKDITYKRKDLKVFIRPSGRIIMIGRGKVATYDRVQRELSHIQNVLDKHRIVCDEIEAQLISEESGGEELHLDFLET